MANLSQTAANVTIGSVTTRTDPVLGGEAITQGMPVYLNTTTNRWHKADANASATTANATGIAMSPCAGLDSPFTVCQIEGARVNLGATLVLGETYVVSATAGAICPIGDLTTGDYTCILGFAISTSLLKTVFAFSETAK